jgi:hypothetical protein
LFARGEKILPQPALAVCGFALLFGPAGKILFHGACLALIVAWTVVEMLAKP